MLILGPNFTGTLAKTLLVFFPAGIFFCGQAIAQSNTELASKHVLVQLVAEPEDEFGSEPDADLPMANDLLTNVDDKTKLLFSVTLGGAREHSVVAPPYKGSKNSDQWNLDFSFGVELGIVDPRLNLQLQYPLLPNQPAGRPNLNYELRPGLEYVTEVYMGLLQNAQLFFSGMAGYGFGKLQYSNATINHYGPFFELGMRWENYGDMTFSVPWANGTQQDQVFAPAVAFAYFSQIPVTKYASVDAFELNNKEGYYHEIAFTPHGDAWAQEMSLRLGLVHSPQPKLSKYFGFLQCSFAQKGYRGLVRRYTPTASAPTEVSDAKRQLWSVSLGIERLD